MSEVLCFRDAPGVFAGPEPAAAAPRAPKVTITHPDGSALLADLEARMRAGQGFTLATLNLDHLVKLRGDAAFRDAYAAHSHVVADGNPVVWAHRLAGRPVRLVPGSDLVGPLVAAAARAGTPVALVGSTETALARAAAHLEAAHPGLRIARRIAPPMGFEPEGASARAVIDGLSDLPAGLCLLALGAPRQERFAAHAARHLPGWGFASVGAGVDFLAGHQRRAPVWMRRLALEWVWRLMRDPRRLARRYAACAAILPDLARRALAARLGR